jgi:hypothetical protein
MLITRNCLVCGTEFTQQTIKGNTRSMCSDACSRQRIRNKRNGRYKERYHVMKAAGATRDYAAWAAKGGNLRYEAALEVLKESE